MARPKYSGRDLPPRMLRRTKKLKNGTLWIAYYYNGRTDAGRRIEIPLGTDLDEAKRKWAELECTPRPMQTGLLSSVFDRYEAEIIPQKAPRTQKDNLAYLKCLRATFGDAPIDAVTPAHIAQYRDRRSAKVRANREISLLSHIYNIAREWGVTTIQNPCTGVRKNREKPRDYYADATVWDAVYNVAPIELKDAMNLAYLTGQRPADVRKMTWHDVSSNTLAVRQNKSTKKLNIRLMRDDGTPNELAKLLASIRERAGTNNRGAIITTADGEALTYSKMRMRFDKARVAAAKIAESDDNPELATRIKQFQFRDIRPKAASEIDDLHAASKLLGHSDKEITRKVYRRIGEKVNPTK